MKIILIAFMIIFSLMACNSNNFAKDQAHSGPLDDYDRKLAPTWTLSARINDKANSNQEFAILQEKYPQYFAKEKAEEIVFAEIIVSEYNFTGPTSCGAGDPKLVFKEKYMSIRYRDGHSINSVPDTPINIDPCKPHKVVVGHGKTCDLAKADGTKRCHDLEYAYAIFQPAAFAGDKGCTESCNGNYDQCAKFACKN